MTNHRRTTWRAGAAALLLLVAACGSDADGSTGETTSSTAGAPGTTTTSTAPPGDPVGIIAVGHSGLTGENSDPARPGAPALENSWATGSNPEVNSVYLRMVEALPDTEGHVVNTAQGGAPSSELRDQVARALKEVPNPALVIIQTLDNDLRCEPEDPNLVSAFGKNVERALSSITKAAPEAQILIVDQLSRPRIAAVESLVAEHPEMQAELTWDDPCSFYVDGQISPDGFSTLTYVIEQFEAEQARVCDAVPQCHTDGGVRKAFRDGPEHYSSDFAHLNVAGNAAAAELVWPVVAEILGVAA